MCTNLRLLLVVSIFIFFAFASAKSHSASLRYDISEFSEIESLESIELDESAKLKVNKLLPRLYKRFCHLTVRPDSVAVFVGLVQVEWSITRICEQSFEKEDDKEVLK